MLKNVSGQKVGAQLITAADGTPFTGSVTVAVTGDAGTQATGSVGSGACTHEGGGYHTYAPAQAETNYDLAAFTFSGTGAISTTVQIYTRPTTGLLAPTTLGRTLDVTSGGCAGVDWANGEAPTTTLGLSGTTVKTATDVETKATAILKNAFVSVELAIGTVTSQTEFILTSGPANDIDNVMAIFFDQSASDAPVIGEGSYDGGTGTLTLTAATSITVTTSDTVTLVAVAADTSAAAIRAAVGLASANLDTQLSTIDTVVDSILVDTGTTLQAELDGIQADTEDIQTRLPAALVSGRIDASVGAMAANVMTASALASDAVTEIQSGLATASSLSTVAGYLDTEIAAILADTNELQTDWANGGRLDLILDTAALGGSGGLDAAGVRAAIGLASANLDTQLGAIDTVVDSILVDTAVIGAAGAGLSAIPWNASWDAEVQSEVQDAIEVNHLDHLLAATYDPTSKPGAADALLNELIENDGGVARYTANALEQAPSGTGASAASIVEAMFDTDTGLTEADAVAGSVVYEIVQNASGGSSGVAATPSYGDVPFGLDGPVAESCEPITGATVIVGDKEITRIRRSDAYDGTANPTKSFPVSKDYTGWTGTLTVRHRVTNASILAKAVTVTSETLLTCSLASTDTAMALLTTDQDFGPHPFDIEMVSGSSKQSAVTGIVILTKDQTT